MRLTVLSYSQSPMQFTTVERGILRIKPGLVQNKKPFTRRTKGTAEALDDLSNMVKGTELPPTSVAQVINSLPAVLDVVIDQYNQVTDVALVQELSIPKKAVVFEEAHLLGLPYIIGHIDNMHFKVIDRANIVLAPWEQHLGGIKTHYRTTVEFKQGAYTNPGKHMQYGRRVPLRVSTYDTLGTDGPLEFPNASDYKLALAILDPNLRITRIYNISPEEYREYKALPYKTRLTALLMHLIER